MPRDSAVRGLFLLCKYLPALALLWVGFFTPHWIENERYNCSQGLLTNSNCTSDVEGKHWIENERYNCSQGLLTNSNCTSDVEGKHWIENERYNCSQGLLTNSNCTSDVEDLHSAVVGLESAAIALLTMATFVNVVLECCYGENNPTTTKARCICAFFFGIGGILGLIGCVAVLRSIHMRQEDGHFGLALLDPSLP